MSDQLWQKSAIELAELVRTKQASSREIVEAHVERISEVNPGLNAVVRLLDDSALVAADEADAAVAAGAELGPLHGVPMTVKENLDLVGSPTTQGMPFLAEAMPTMDSPPVERMKAAGAIPIGRTNMPELGLRISTDNPLHGLTRNPWHPDFTAGGSSGGEGSAISSGMSPIGLGNDIGGSLRNPAFCCGIASIKPTHGRVPSAGSVEPTEASLAANIMATDGPMARTIADVRLGLQLISGQHVRDPRSVSVPFESPSGPKKAGLVTSMHGGPVDEAFVQAVRDAGAALEAQGYEVEEVEAPELERVNDVWANLLAASVGNVVPLLDGVMEEKTFAYLKAFTETYATPGPIDLITGEVGRLGKVWAAFLAEYPVLVSPVWANAAFAHGDDLEEDGFAVGLDRLRMITPGNLLGLPAAVVTTGIANDMPKAVQIMADRFGDDKTLDAAEIIESASPVIWPSL